MPLMITSSRRAQLTFDYRGRSEFSNAAALKTAWVSEQTPKWYTHQQLLTASTVRQ